MTCLQPQTKSVSRMQDLNLGPDARLPWQRRQCLLLRRSGNLTGQTRQARETISEQDNCQAHGIIP